MDVFEEAADFLFFFLLFLLEAGFELAEASGFFLVFEEGDRAG